MESEKKTMHFGEKHVLLIAMILVAGVATIAILRDKITNSPQWTVSVIGRAEIAYQPDEATINMGVQVERVIRADSALDQLNEKIDNVLEAVEKVGLESKNISTLSYNLSPQYDYYDGRQVLAGYTASQQIVVKIKDLENNKELLGKVIQAASQAGVNQVNSIQFNVSDVDSLKDRARLEAFADARSKAGQMASAAGVKLDKTVGWWENFLSQPGQPGPYYEGYGLGAGGGGGSPAIPVSEQEIVLEMNVNYLVK